MNLYLRVASSALFYLLMVLIAPVTASAQSAELFKDIAPGVASSSPQQFVRVGNKLFFLANHPDTGVELWVSDGSSAGTHLVKDIYPGNSNNSYQSNYWLNPSNLTAFGDLLLFVAPYGEGQALWKSDGSSAGTVVVKGFPYAGVAYYTGLVKFGNSVYFAADDGVHLQELWKSDGTTAGTQLVVDLSPDMPGSSYLYSQRLVALPDRLLFNATDFTTRTGLWSTDGTATGTEFLGEFEYFQYFDVRVLGSVAFFGCRFGSEYGLCVSDGTSAGTKLLQSFVDSQGNPRQLVLQPAGNELAFLVIADPIQVWRSDGTIPGTQQISTFPYISTYLPPEYSSVEYNGKAVFPLRGPNLSKTTLLGSDGTTAGTFSLAILNMSLVKPFIFEGRMLMHACPYTLNDCELWESNGTFLGNQPVSGISNATKALYESSTKLGDRYFGAFDDGISGSELWVLSPPDNCPSDPNKLEPGTCGCGFSDEDEDGDGAIACYDACPLDPLKLLSAGACGCGQLEIDQSGNGIYDCKDPSLTSLPPKPVVVMNKDKVIVTMPSYSKVTYEITLYSTPTNGQLKQLKKKGKKMLSRSISTTTKSVIFPRVNAGKGYAVYRMLSGIGEQFATQLSPKGSFVVKHKRKH